MHYSPHQLAYFAHQLTLRGAANSIDRMAGTLLDAQVDLNPHQIDAALFGTSNPLSMGVILADQVGLGKTIEAGLLIAHTRHDQVQVRYERLIGESKSRRQQQQSPPR